MSSQQQYPGHFVVVQGESRWECDVREGGVPCGTVVGGKKGDIASHRKMHQAQSAYARDAEKFAHPVECTENTRGMDGKDEPCGWAMTNRNNMLAHYRRSHEHRGDKNVVFEKYGV